MIPTDDWEAMHDISLPDLPPEPPTLPSITAEATTGQ